MSTETPANVVKASTFPKSNKKYNNYRPCVSDKGTGPLNDVTYFDEKKREYVTIKGLTEEQKVAQGYMPPLAWQGAKLPVAEGEENKGGTVGRFPVTKADRESISYARRTCQNKGRGTAPIVHSFNEPRGTLIVHLVNYRRKVDFKDFKAVVPPSKTPSGFKTTYSFKDVKKSEINDVIGTIVRLNRNKADDHALNYVNKYYFRGKEYEGHGQRSN